MYHLTGLLSISHCIKNYHQLNTCVDLTSSVDQFYHEFLIRIHYSSKCTNSLYFWIRLTYFFKLEYILRYTRGFFELMDYTKCSYKMSTIAPQNTYTSCHCHVLTLLVM